MKAIILLLLLASCVSLRTKMDRTIGMTESELVINWGQPDKTDRYGSKKLYIYVQPTYAGTYGTQYRYTTFFIDHHGIVESWNVRDRTEPVERINVSVLVH